MFVVCLVLFVCMFGFCLLLFVCVCVGFFVFAGGGGVKGYI